MDYIYLIFVIVLFVLAISDLVVGVSNDAVNFLNSAIGAKAAPGHIIMIVASLGVLIGATFSGGMMEVARKGIFNPEMFSFANIMTIFLAVMITDVILLDLFNTFGLPTSTTVSIVFELLGASVAVAGLSIAMSDGETIDNLGAYINSGSALLIIGGILLSVVVAFVIGSAVQYLSRLLFSFRYRRNLKWAGSAFGGLAISAIFYFIVIKGLKGTTYVPEHILTYIKTHTFTIIGASFIGWTLILQILYFLFKTNAPRVVVIVGTFALAMAFAGNDLVNFIGVPLAGLASYKAFIASGVGDPNLFMMDVLRQPVESGTLILLGAGAIMIATLWTSSKAKAVVKTTVDLSRQDEGSERFESTKFSRFLVRSAVGFSEGIDKVVPKKIREGIESRFQRPDEPEDPGQPAFDMIRASVNLSVASILIAIATSFKLPLSTTYVTFMVAMGTSLADRAWGRDSAVYRITGVLSVVTGWFMTAIVAFTAAFLVATLIFFTKLVGIIIMVAVAVGFIVKTHALHKNNLKKKQAQSTENEQEFFDGTGKYIQRSNNSVKTALLKTSKIYFVAINGLVTEDRRKLKAIRNEAIDFNDHVKDLKDNLYRVIKKLNKFTPETGHYYVQVLDYMREMAHSINFMVQPTYEHIANKHKGLTSDQQDDLTALSEKITNVFNKTIHLVKEMKYETTAEMMNEAETIINDIHEYRRVQIKRIKKGDVNTRNSMLYLGILQESKNVLLFLNNLIKAQRDFIIYTEKQRD
jgi:phosphate/sulfate permease